MISPAVYFYLQMDCPECVIYFSQGALPNHRFWICVCHFAKNHVWFKHKLSASQNGHINLSVVCYYYNMSHKSYL